MLSMFRVRANPIRISRVKVNLGTRVRVMLLGPG
jgi:hypothetical protein